MTFSVSNGVEVGSTDFGMVKPADYPGFLQAGACAAVMPYGAWWNMMTLTVSGRTVPARDTTWGPIKARYRD